MTTNWDDQTQQYSSITRRRYGDALRGFTEWYRATYGEPPDICLLTPQEVREYVAHLTTVRRLKAASVNVRLAAIRSLARFHERELRVRDVCQEHPPVEALDGRELGRLMAALEGDDWISRRNRARVALMARAGLRVGEVLALKPEDVELNARSGRVLMRKGKGMKERWVPLSAEARRELREYLEVRPRRSGPLFFSRTYQPLTGRDVQPVRRAPEKRPAQFRFANPMKWCIIKVSLLAGQRTLDPSVQIPRIPTEGLKLIQPDPLKQANPSLNAPNPDWGD